jgi:hypothetical protein
MPVNEPCDVCEAVGDDVLEYDFELLGTATTIYLCSKCNDNNKEN